MWGRIIFIHKYIDMIRDFNTYINEGILDRNASEFSIIHDNDGVKQVEKIDDAKELTELIHKRILAANGGVLDLGDIEYANDSYMDLDLDLRKNEKFPTKVILPYLSKTNSDGTDMSIFKGILGYNYNRSNINLQHVVINSTYRSIPEHIFEGCNNLKIVEFVGNFNDLKIKKCAFKKDISLKSIELPKGTTVIETNAFVGCSSLENVIIPDTVERIGFCAFLGCSDNIDLQIPESILARLVNNYAIGSWLGKIEKVLQMDK